MNVPKLERAAIGLVGAILMAVLLLGLLPHLAGAIFEGLGTRGRAFMFHPLFPFGGLPFSLALLIKAVVFLVVLATLSSLTRRLVRIHILAHTSMEVGLQCAVATFIRYLVFTLGIVVGLQMTGVNLSSLVVLGGALGIGVGLGLQQLAGNFVSGLVLLFERPIKVGDRIQVGDTSGGVVRIAARSTWVRTNENVVIIIPNSEFTSNRVINWTANDRRVRFSVTVGVSYGSPPGQVTNLLLKVAREHPDVLDEPEPEVLFADFGDSSLNFELRVWTIRQVQTPSLLKSELRFAIFAIFQQHGIEMPFPQRDVYGKQWPGTKDGGTAEKAIEE